MQRADPGVRPPRLVRHPLGIEEPHRVESRSQPAAFSRIEGCRRRGRYSHRASLQAGSAAGYSSRNGGRPGCEGAAGAVARDGHRARRLPELRRCRGHPAQCGDRVVDRCRRRCRARAGSRSRAPPRRSRPRAVGTSGRGTEDCPSSNRRHAGRRQAGVRPAAGRSPAPGARRSALPHCLHPPARARTPREALRDPLAHGGRRRTPQTAATAAPQTRPADSSANDPGTLRCYRPARSPGREAGHGSAVKSPG